MFHGKLSERQGKAPDEFLSPLRCIIKLAVYLMTRRPDE
jgi:hypothetical protein